MSRRDLLRAGGIALVAGVALAGCAKTGAGGNETPRSTSETQRSNDNTYRERTRYDQRNRSTDIDRNTYTNKNADTYGIVDTSARSVSN